MSEIGKVRGIVIVCCIIYCLFNIVYHVMAFNAIDSLVKGEEVYWQKNKIWVYVSLILVGLSFVMAPFSYWGVVCSIIGWLFVYWTILVKPSYEKVGIEISDFGHYVFTFALAIFWGFWLFFFVYFLLEFDGGRIMLFRKISNTGSASNHPNLTPVQIPGPVAFCIDSQQSKSTCNNTLGQCRWDNKLKCGYNDIKARKVIFKKGYIPFAQT